MSPSMSSRQKCNGMQTTVTYPNLQSRLFMRGAAKSQPTAPFVSSKPVAAVVRWIERHVLGVRTENIPLDRPIFMLSMPRSGTTMLQDILCMHEGIAYVNNAMNRFPTMCCFIETFRKGLGLDFEAQRFIGDSVTVSPSSPSGGIAYWGQWFHMDPFSIAYHPYRIEDFSPQDLENMHDMVKRAVWCFGKPWRRFFIKMIAIYPHAELVNHLFPDARILHVVRDGRQAANSMCKQLGRWIEHQKNTGLYQEDPVNGDRFFVPYPRFPKLAENAEKFGLRDVRTAAHLWNDAASHLREIRHTFKHFYQVRYEDIVENPERELKGILEFLQLPPVPPENRNYWAHVAKVGHVQHVNRYDQFDVVEDICRDNLKYYGYL
jgi:hypothetical protein